MTLSIENPATGQRLAELESDDARRVLDKVARARRAQPAWKKRPLAERKAAIARFRDLVAKNQQELALTLTREMGKPVSQALNELNALTSRIDFFLGAVDAVLADEAVFRDSGVEELIRHEPLGVVANVSAWNYPWFVGSNVYVPALLTGNTVVYKPSELATLSGQAMARLLHEAGVPEDVFVPVIGAREAGAALVDAPIDGFFFTGSYATGRAIAERLGPRLLRMGFELGGKDPAYVTSDVDVQKAAESLADGAMYNTGQSCCSVERIYVEKSVLEPFVEAFLATVAGFRLGDPEDSRTYIGPLARAQQLEVLSAQVADAVARGGRVLTGGQRVDRAGNYFQPTVIGNADNTMRVLREESFGPIIGIAAVSDDAEAIQKMNDTEYGLTAGVYTRDRTRAEAILSQVDSGSVYWNCCDRVSPRLPWTGRRHSGLGSTLSTHGIRTFLQPKAWHLRNPA
ncbi:MAG: aldehyde dehydrogenase family protein [Myxococcota bacterium]|jgi:acyl-CoA reductase-like NAD-dependent aldehyde dehydrogenase|nr:aldehyde dehydrogenase family protein [Myxococcota bacterium]